MIAKGVKGLSSGSRMVGLILRLVRKRAGLTVKQFAEKLGITPGALAIIECGARFPGERIVLKALSYADPGERERLARLLFWSLAAGRYPELSKAAGVSPLSEDAVKALEDLIPWLGREEAIRVIAGLVEAGEKDSKSAGGGHGEDTCQSL